MRRIGKAEILISCSSHKKQRRADASLTRAPGSHLHQAQEWPGSAPRPRVASPAVLPKARSQAITSRHQRAQCPPKLRVARPHRSWKQGPALPGPAPAPCPTPEAQEVSWAPGSRPAPGIQASSSSAACPAVALGSPMAPAYCQPTCTGTVASGGFHIPEIQEPPVTPGVLSSLWCLWPQAVSS